MDRVKRARQYYQALSSDELREKLRMFTVELQVASHFEIEQVTRARTVDKASIIQILMERGETTQ